MSQVGQTWSLSRGESEQLHTLSYLYKLILIGDLTVVTHYSHLLLMKKKLILKIQSLQSSDSIKVFSASSSVSAAQGGFFVVLVQVSPQHSRFMAASQTKPQMNCRCIARPLYAPPTGSVAVCVVKWSRIDNQNTITYKSKCECLQTKRQ